MKIFSTVFKLERTKFRRQNSKGQNSVTDVGGVTFFFLCNLSENGLYLYKIHEN